MVRGKFAGLGFDPTPGSAGDVRAAADAMSGAGDQLAGAPGSMRAVLTTGNWQGTTAEGFAASGAAVPGALESAHGELRAASTALRTWHGRLLVNQHAAERLEKTAKQLRRDIAEAERDVLAADARLAAATGPARAKAEADLRAAHQGLTRLKTRLATTLRAAHRLAQRHQREADTAAAALRGNPPEPSWPAGAVDGVATGVGGTSAWTGQVATITLPGETDPVVALPIGAQPGDPNWPVLPDPAQQAPLDPAEIPDDLTGAASAPIDPLVPISPVDGLPADPTSERPGTDITRPATATVLAPAEPVVAAVADRAPVAARHREPAVARVVTTPSHVVRSTVQEAVPSTPVHRATTSHRSTTTVTRTYETVRHGEPSHHVPASDPAPQHRSTQGRDTRHGSTPEGGTHRSNTPASAEPHPLRPAPLSPAAPAAAGAPGAELHHKVTAVVPVPSDATTAETAAVAPPRADTGPSPSPAAPATPTPSTSHHSQPSQAPGEQAPRQAAPSHLAQAPGQQVTAVDQGRAPSQPGTGHGGQQAGNAEHRKADSLPVAAPALELAPGVFTGVVLPAPPHWDGTSVLPLREAGLLPDTADGLWATFIITAALGPALIAESIAGSRERGRENKQRRGKQNRMRAFVLQPGGEQLVMLTLQGRSAEGWTTQRALFLRAVAQYRRPAEVPQSS